MIPNAEDRANRIKALHAIMQAALVELIECIDLLREETKKDGR